MLCFKWRLAEQTVLAFINMCHYVVTYVLYMF